MSLGLGDRLVGSAFADGPLPEELAAAADGVPEVSDGVPSQEAVLDLEPDFVFAGCRTGPGRGGAGVGARPVGDAQRRGQR